MASGNAYFPTGAVKSNNYKINESEIAMEVKFDINKMLLFVLQYSLADYGWCRSSMLG